MTVIRIVVTVGAFALIARKVGFKSVLHAFAHSDPMWLAAGYAVAVVTIILTVWQWHGLAAANGVSRPYRRCLHLELAGDVFDAALPSSIGGDFIRATSLAETPEERVPSWPWGCSAPSPWDMPPASGPTRWSSWPGASCSWP
jgi:uncharacterized membrane protein YbhN (UPF0104 family)